MHPLPEGGEKEVGGRPEGGGQERRPAPELGLVETHLQGHPGVVAEARAEGGREEAEEGGEEGVGTPAQESP